MGQRQASAMQSAANFDAAVALYGEALNQLDSLPEPPVEQMVAVHKAAARCCKQVQEFKKVVSHCSAALELVPDDVQLFTLRAQAYEGLEKNELAMENYKAAREVA